MPVPAGRMKDALALPPLTVPLVTGVPIGCVRAASWNTKNVTVPSLTGTPGVLVFVTVALSGTVWTEALNTATALVATVEVLPGTIVMLYAMPPTFGGTVLSVALMLKLNVPAVVGVPVILPPLSTDKPV